MADLLIRYGMAGRRHIAKDYGGIKATENSKYLRAREIRLPLTPELDAASFDELHQMIEFGMLPDLP